ncbi:hypothetical protein [Herbiconiux sp. VKM Ac-2851]|uniref:hypothetical protein n=1 Tax=Herbiconiux sp. VKM Ac-2851 TaxID=2739025 RepID=UPI00156653A2|nr:hypothetical protein [Herbiconiux sp. VKM Ac-2851]NQX36107.1 hypothetical protein [Herbiconiux sp. VKM Ac-2851]
MALTLHRSGHPLAASVLNEVLVRAEAAGEVDASVRAASALGEIEVDSASVGDGLALMTAAAERAAGLAMWTLAAASFRSVCGVAVRRNEVSTAISAAERAAECFAQNGDPEPAARQRAFAALWRDRLESRPEVDWGAWARSG